jgi:hypothetical protein
MEQSRQSGHSLATRIALSVCGILVALWCALILYANVGRYAAEYGIASAKCAPFLLAGLASLLSATSALVGLRGGGILGSRLHWSSAVALLAAAVVDGFSDPLIWIAPAVAGVGLGVAVSPFGHRLARSFGRAARATFPRLGASPGKSAAASMSQNAALGGDITLLQPIADYVAVREHLRRSGNVATVLGMVAAMLTYYAYLVLSDTSHWGEYVAQLLAGILFLVLAAALTPLGVLSIVRAKPWLFLAYFLIYGCAALFWVTNGIVCFLSASVGLFFIPAKTGPWMPGWLELPVIAVISMATSLFFALPAKRHLRLYRRFRLVSMLPPPANLVEEHSRVRKAAFAPDTLRDDSRVPLIADGDMYAMAVLGRQTVTLICKTGDIFARREDVTFEPLGPHRTGGPLRGFLLWRGIRIRVRIDSPAKADRFVSWLAEDRG